MPFEGKLVAGLNLGKYISDDYGKGITEPSKLLSVALFLLIAGILVYIGTRRSSGLDTEDSQPV
jgi:hypothetical protein